MIPARRTRVRRLGWSQVVVLGLLLGVAACGATDDGGGTDPDGSAPAASAVGDLRVTLDGDQHDFELTSCTLGEQRLTFQGADGDGTTAVGVLAADGSSGSVTVSDQDGVLAAGEAVDHAIADLEVDGTGASGSGTFAVQEYGEVQGDTRPVEDTGETVEGSFEVTCED